MKLTRFKKEKLRQLYEKRYEQMTAQIEAQQREAQMKRVKDIAIQNERYRFLTS